MNKEKIISGVIVDHPRVIFKNFDNEQSIMGFVYKIRTTQLVGYEYQPTEIWIKSVYDLNKWDILHKGDELELSILQRQNSEYSDDKLVLKCNITKRRKRIQIPEEEKQMWDDLAIMMEDLFDKSKNTI